MRKDIIYQKVYADSVALRLTAKVANMNVLMIRTDRCNQRLLYGHGDGGGDITSNLCSVVR